MSKNYWGFQMPDSFFETQRIIKNMTSGLETWNKLNQNFSYVQNVNSIAAMVAPYQNILRECIPHETARIITENFAGLQGIVAELQIPKFVNLSSALGKILPIINNAWEPPIINYEWANEKLNERQNASQEEIIKVLTEEVQQELDESIQETIVSSNPQNNVESKYVEWKQRHPILADIFLVLVLSIISSFISGMLVNWATGVLTKPANVYEEPKSNSNIVINVDINQTVTITNDIPYYYEVIFKDPETGVEKAGYISKKNIIITDNNIE